jgi:Xaa-Pro aminopeptidase
VQRLTEIQAALRAAGLDGWLLYDFRGLNPIAARVARLPAGHLFTRRWVCFIPAAQGAAPRWLVHGIEAGAFRDARPATYVSWMEWRTELQVLLAGARRVAMEVSPGCAIPTVSRVDAGTVELVRSLGVEVASSADLVQVAEAVWTVEQLAGHRRAAAALLAVKDEAFAHVRSRLAAGQPVTEAGLQRFMLERFSQHSLISADPPIVAVNGHAADPHFAPKPEADTPVRRGDLLLLDLWARERGEDAVYADITWIGYCGPEAPPRVRELFGIVRAARDGAVAFIRERLTAGQPVYGYEADDAARGIIVAAGYGPRFIHRTGHSIGTTDHGNGVNLDNLETQDGRRLIPGVGFSVEPGIYLPEENIGIRSEINCHVSPAGEGDGLEVTTLPLQEAVVVLLDA